jgi:hypothetical protein
MREVDMRFTKEHGIVRMRIGCANPQGIPSRLIMFMKRKGMEFYFM